MSKTKSPQDQSRPTHTVEDYLMTMHVLERDYGEIIPARLADMLGVAPPTVTMTLKRMERDHWITGTGRKAVHFTEVGRAAAQSVTRRHMLTEWLLVKILKVPLYETHTEAHNIEHAISPQLEERMADVLGHPKTCPHGNPMPGYESVVSKLVPLTELAEGEAVIIRRIHEFGEDNHELLKFLVENGAMPGTQIKVTQILPFNQTVSITAANNSITLGFPAARFIFTERVR